MSDPHLCSIMFCNDQDNHYYLGICKTCFMGMKLSILITVHLSQCPKEFMNDGLTIRSSLGLFYIKTSNSIVCEPTLIVASSMHLEGYERSSHDAQSSVESVRPKHGVNIPRTNICFPFKDLSHKFSIANIEVAANVTQLFYNPWPNVWTSL